MPVQITITGENAKEALQEIGGLAFALVGAAAPETNKSAKTQTQTAPKTTEKKIEDPVKTQVSSEPETHQKEVTGDKENIPTIVELREKAAAVAKADKANGPKIKTMLSEYGYDAVSKVDEKDRAAVMKALEVI
ncbi:hypothetical protein [Paenibacillus sp. FSL L8-0333]|uniref:hypothetical protein n=1 Tax=Paenibacillus sp. FSL L8-0333 TaxID=2975331 RepID=UPI0030CC59DA